MLSLIDQQHLSRALALAQQGKGYVEPNPQVGCAIACNGKIVGEGWHQQFGGPHAEVIALQQSAEQARGADLVVTLEPCCHHGQTPPCTEAIIKAGIARVVVGCLDPNPHVAGQGIAALRAAGLVVELAEEQQAYRRLIAPFEKLITTGMPWVSAKWAMTLDGKIATRTGCSQWISNESSREIVHRLRGQMDAILIGRGTLTSDDPTLTARPAGPRIATRIVLDSQAILSVQSNLVRTIAEAPVLLVVGEQADGLRLEMLEKQGVEILRLAGPDRLSRIHQLLLELGKRRMTNILVEGGSEVLGSFFDLGAVDEIHAFIAPRVLGGKEAPTPVAGQGVAEMTSAIKLANVDTRIIEGDVYIHAEVHHL